MTAADDHRHLTVGELRDLIADLPDGAPVAYIYDGMLSLIGDVGIMDDFHHRPQIRDDPEDPEIHAPEAIVLTAIWEDSAQDNWTHPENRAKPPKPEPAPPPRAPAPAAEWSTIARYGVRRQDAFGRWVTDYPVEAAIASPI
ncbi:hypothetical protein IC744_00060 [Microbacterium hominis]|uniref:hypothetical protein n=1 Tax=Microbacterium hominis TaxID=162426 RepID=UPI00168BEB71|nr:hypothetical protein [Microbacterium hominis]QOC24853.1 hypothetical protein IC745_10710 [Microbacterium hominis]QOC28906.1 hypothetical protein IC744_00060 [Microbacterium hominis]